MEARTQYLTLALGLFEGPKDFRIVAVGAIMQLESFTHASRRSPCKQSNDILFFVVLLVCGWSALSMLLDRW